MDVIEAGAGGTDNILPAEREKASFDTEKLVRILGGGLKNTLQRKFIMSAHEEAEQFVHAEVDREALIAHAVQHFMEVHSPHLKRGYKPKEMDMSYMSDARMTSSVMVKSRSLWKFSGRWKVVTRGVT